MKILISIFAAILLTLVSACFPRSSLAVSPSPRPAVSEYFSDNAIGFIVEHQKRGVPDIVRYAMGFIITKKIASPLYVRTRFENPADPAHPLIVDLVLRPGAKTFALQSRPVYGLKGGGQYKVEVLVFDSPSRTHEISRHVTQAEFFSD
jgi:hypothetical protein